MLCRVHMHKHHSCVTYIAVYRDPTTNPLITTPLPTLSSHPHPQPLPTFSFSPPRLHTLLHPPPLRPSPMPSTISLSPRHPRTAGGAAPSRSTTSTHPQPPHMHGNSPIGAGLFPGTDLTRVPAFSVERGTHAHHNRLQHTTTHCNALQHTATHMHTASSVEREARAEFARNSGVTSAVSQSEGGGHGWRDYSAGDIDRAARSQFACNDNSRDVTCDVLQSERGGRDLSNYTVRGVSPSLSLSLSRSCSRRETTLERAARWSDKEGGLRCSRRLFEVVCVCERK